MEPFIGEIALFPYNQIPTGWAACDGKILPIQQNTALFSLLGIKYGGDGKQNFALPDLRGRTIVSQGILNSSAYRVGNSGGLESVTLTTDTIPPHNHLFSASSQTATTNAPINHLLATANAGMYAGSLTNPQVISPATVGNYVGGQPHPNVQPSIALQYCIATSGLYPMRP